MHNQTKKSLIFVKCATFTSDQQMIDIVKAISINIHS
jgi:hypothetical protein